MQALGTNEQGVVEKCPIITDHLQQWEPVAAADNVHIYLRNVNTKNVLETQKLMSGPYKRGNQCSDVGAQIRYSHIAYQNRKIKEVSYAETVVYIIKVKIKILKDLKQSSICLNANILWLFFLLSHNVSPPACNDENLKITM
jgi:hypothetical protein